MADVPEHERIAKGGLSDDEQQAGVVAALKRERDAYLRHGMSDRATQVEEQLRIHGVDVEPGEVGAEKGDARRQAPRGRSTRPQQTTKD